MTIQYVMLVSLGFLIASLITLLLAPLFWQRAVRLTSRRLRQSLPLSENEIQADKDHLRAKYAIRVHQLEKQVEQASLSTARQKIDLNRRDASISNLEVEITRLQSGMEETQNARSVLEQTVADRIPKIEARLEEARKLLVLRDREISDLSQSTRRQQEALNETRVINQKQAGDVERLKTQLLAYEAQSRKGVRDGDLEGELAIRAELEVLRTRVQDQASLIERLNEGAGAGHNGGPVLASATDLDRPAQIAGSDPIAVRARIREQDVLIDGLRGEIAALQLRPELPKDGAGLQAAKSSTGRSAASLEQEVRTLTEKAEDQSAEILRLRTELAVATPGEAGANGLPSLRENRIALKARLGGIEAKSTQQAQTIQRLRAELAQANERAARQAAGFMDEMRRLGIAAHVTQARSGRAQQETTRSRNVARRTQAVFESSRSQTLAPASAGEEARTAPKTLGRRMAASAQAGKGAGSNGARNGSGANDTAPPIPNGRVGNLVAALRGGGAGANGAAQTASPEPVKDPAAASAKADAEAPRQSRLLDRITATDKAD